MTRIRIWLVVIAAAGVVSSAMAAGLLWFILTHPVAVVEALGGRL